MAIKKIPCGGWSYDDSEIVFEDGVIHPIGGGGSDIFWVTFTMDDEDITIDKTYDELFEAWDNKQPIMGIAYGIFDGHNIIYQNVGFNDGAFMFINFDISSNYANANVIEVTRDADSGETLIEINSFEFQKATD